MNLHFHQEKKNESDEWKMEYTVVFLKYPAQGKAKLEALSLILSYHSSDKLYYIIILILIHPS
jgi:hypothetical protein